MQNGTTVSECFQLIRRKLIEELGADPSPDDAYTVLRGVLTPFRRDETFIATLSPRDRRVFPVLVDIAESGIKAALKTVRVTAPAPKPLSSPEASSSIFCLAALRLSVIAVLAALLLSGAPLVFNSLFALAAVVALALIEVTPFVRQWRTGAEWALFGRDRRRACGGRRYADSMNPDGPGSAQTLETETPAARLAVETSAFVDQVFDVMLSVDKTLRLIDEPAEPKPRTLISDKDALALMQDLIAARTDGDGERALVLLRQLEPLLLSHGVSVHHYCPELAGMFTIQSGPEGSAPATLRPALVAGGRIVAAGVAEIPRAAEGSASLRAENRGAR